MTRSDVFEERIIRYFEIKRTIFCFNPKNEMKFGSNGPTVPIHCDFLTKLKIGEIFPGQNNTSTLEIINKKGIKSWTHKVRNTIDVFENGTNLSTTFLESHPSKR